jgi:hypothetical protein
MISEKKMTIDPEFGKYNYSLSERCKGVIRIATIKM